MEWNIIANFASSKENNNNTKNKNNMLRTIKSISEFKEMATLTHDNRKTASKNWSKTWGMAYWMDVWYYKEYSIGSLKYRVGQVVQRHTKYSVKKYYLADKEISEKEFFEKANTIEYKPKNRVICTQPKPKYQQLSLFDEEAC